MTIEAIKNRRSVREYKSDPVSDEDMAEIIKAAQFVPTGHGNAAVEFVVVRNQETKNRIHEATGADEMQIFVKTAPVLLIPITDTEKATLSTQDLSVASENIFLEAVSRGLGSVWKNVSPDQVPEIRKILGLPENFVLINVIPIGYPNEMPEAKSDSDFDSAKIHLEKW
jgi:nitroreductase